MQLVNLFTAHAGCFYALLLLLQAKPNALFQGLRLLGS